MLNIQLTEHQGLKCLELEGRIDSLTSSDLEFQINNLANQGERIIICDLGKVSYISSSGLRVFLIAQKLLTKVGGELLIFNLNELLKNIFLSAGFDKIIKIVNDVKDVELLQKKKSKPLAINNIKFGNVEFTYSQHSEQIGQINFFGNPNKFISSSFSSNDVNYIYPADIKFGLGLAGIGTNYDDYKELIGEALIINQNLFVYPATKRPIVDYIYYSKFNPIGKYPFLYGFTVKGNYNIIGTFNSQDEFLSLEDLISNILNLSSSNLLALVFISESKGILGLNIKKPPIIENTPENKNITSEENFSNWFDFPIEPQDYNNKVVAFGIIKRNNLSNSSINKYFPIGINYHFHCMVLDFLLINNDIDEFNNELDRLCYNYHPKSILHLLGGSKFSSGLFGIINLKDE